MLYPLDISAITDSYSYGDRNIPVIIEVPIGTASVSTSREQIGYDEQTERNLGEIYMKVREEIVEKIQATLNAPDSYHKACEKYVSLRGQLQYRMMPGKILWREKYELRQQFTWNGSSGAKLRTNFLGHSQGLEWRTNKHHGINLQPADVRECVIVWDADDCTFDKERLREYRHQNPGQDIIWYKGNIPEKATEYYGLETIVDLRKYDRRKLPRGSQGSRGYTKADIRKFDRHRNIHPNFNFSAPVVYVFSDGQDYNLCGNTVSYDDASWYVSKAYELNKFDAGAEVIVILKNQRNLIQDHWVCIDDLVKELATEFNPKAFRNRDEIFAILNQPMAARLRERREQLPKLLKNFFDDITDTPANSAEDRVRARIWQVMTGKDLPPSRTKLLDRFNNLIKRYPLMELVYRDTEKLDHYLKLIAR